MEIDGTRSPFRFDGVIRQAVYQLKYNNIRTLATPLARLLYEFIIENPIPGEILVPVPLHSKRLRERGYNQSALIARQLLKMLDIPVVNDCLFRQRHTPSQATSTNIAQRQSNVRHAFSSQHDGLKDKQVILIDDVATSGATLNACANTIKTAGVASVWGLVLARET